VSYFNGNTELTAQISF